MQVHVAFTPEEHAAARVGIVVDVIQATSSIVQALASGYERVLCCAEIDEARALRAELGAEAVVGGERDATRIEGFDLGTSPREFCAQIDLLDTVPRFPRMVGSGAEIVA